MNYSFQPSTDRRPLPRLRTGNPAAAAGRLLRDFGRAETAGVARRRAPAHARNLQRTTHRLATLQPSGKGQVGGFLELVLND